MEELVKKLHLFRVMDTELIPLRSMYEYIKRIWRLERRCFIFCFFERSQFQSLIDVVKDLVVSADHVDDYLCVKLPKMIEGFYLDLEKEVKRRTSARRCGRSGRCSSGRTSSTVWRRR